MVAVDPRPFLHQALRWTAVLAAAVAIIAGLRFDWMLGLSIWIGAGIGIGNLWLLGATLETMVRAVEPAPEPAEGAPAPSKARTGALVGALLLKLPLLLLAMLVLVKVLPLRLEGIAIGVLLALVGAVVAALDPRSKAGSSKPSRDEGQTGSSTDSGG